MLYIFYALFSALLGLFSLGLGLGVLAKFQHRPQGHHLGWSMLVAGLASLAHVGGMLSPWGEPFMWSKIAFSLACLYLPLAFWGIVLYRGNPQEEQIPLTIILGLGLSFGLAGWLWPGAFFAKGYWVEAGGLRLEQQPPNFWLGLQKSFDFGLLVLMTAFTMRFMELENKLRVWQLFLLSLAISLLLGLGGPMEASLGGQPLPRLAPLVYPLLSFTGFYLFVGLRPEIKLSYAIALNPAAWHDLRNLVQALGDQHRASLKPEPGLGAAILALQAYVEAISRPKTIHGEYLQKEEVLVTAILKEACDFWSQNAQRKNINCQIELPPEDIILTLDPVGWRRSVDNLWQNALKFTPPGGQISLQVSLGQSDYVLEIRDTGIGIPAAEQARIFEPGQRASNTGGIPGQGLGLAVVAHFAAQHGGELSLESRPGAGSRFRLRLPMD
jgi:signal transduction histidine kinase